MPLLNSFIQKFFIVFLLLILTGMSTFASEEEEDDLYNPNNSRGSLESHNGDNQHELQINVYRQPLIERVSFDDEDIRTIRSWGNGTLPCEKVLKALLAAILNIPTLQPGLVLGTTSFRTLFVSLSEHIPKDDLAFLIFNAFPLALVGGYATYKWFIEKPVPSESSASKA